MKFLYVFICNGQKVAFTCKPINIINCSRNICKDMDLQMVKMLLNCHSMKVRWHL